MKMTNGSIACEISTTPEMIYVSCVPCEYEKDTIRYAVERFFARCGKLRRECTFESWQFRIAKGRKKRESSFSYLIPAILMELPGEWVRITGKIDAIGVTVWKVEILSRYPDFKMK
ncbi:MAG: hypothetical protein LUH07_00910 [Lachnospiraceae bacterium]|nr:hypothetical protein [Lachnospiraceae bacterium]